MFRRQGFLQLRRIAARCEGEPPRRSGKCLNSVQLIGYTGSDPLRGSTEFQPTKFSLATTVYYKTRNETLESKTEWHNISVFKPSLQEKVNGYVRKGTRLFVQGSIQYNNYVDQEGIKRYNTSIVPSKSSINPLKSVECVGILILTHMRYTTQKPKTNEPLKIRIK
ncbi:unnamed protein product [Porites evermanni]|uniref:Single-stranded DNA-binding protein, mitochondrial n=1 Tax=Porites evermanni TaxID=104178 RepID=A0ABN8LY47_9CNID|nr:unnamed protein product [Porites evermanni]